MIGRLVQFDSAGASRSGLLDHSAQAAVAHEQQVAVDALGRRQQVGDALVRFEVADEPDGEGATG